MTEHKDDKLSKGVSIAQKQAVATVTAGKFASPVAHAGAKLAAGAAPGAPIVALGEAAAVGGPAGVVSGLGQIGGGFLGSTIGGAVGGETGKEVGQEVGEPIGAVGAGAAAGALIGGPVGAAAGAAMGVAVYGANKAIQGVVYACTGDEQSVKISNTSQKTIVVKSYDECDRVQWSSYSKLTLEPGQWARISATDGAKMPWSKARCTCFYVHVFVGGDRKSFGHGERVNIGTDYTWNGRSLTVQ